MDTIADELIETSKNYINDIVKTVYEKPYEDMLINTDSQRIFKGFDKLIVSDD